jgi:hypothetical protein
MVLPQSKYDYMFNVENSCIMKEEPSAALSSLQLLHGVTSINIYTSCFDA